MMDQRPDVDIAAQHQVQEYRRRVEEAVTRTVAGDRQAAVRELQELAIEVSAWLATAKPAGDAEREARALTAALCQALHVRPPLATRARALKPHLAAITATVQAALAATATRVALIVARLSGALRLRSNQ